MNIGRFPIAGYGSFKIAGYDSEIEQEFAHVINKYIRRDVLCGVQFEVYAGGKNRLIDLVAKMDGLVVGFEIDGAEYHKDKKADNARDLAVLSSGYLNAIYRFAAVDVWYHREDCMSFILKHDPSLFWESAEIQLEKLISDEMAKQRGAEGQYSNGTQIVFYHKPEHLQFPNQPRDWLSIMQRRTLQNVNVWNVD